MANRMRDILTSGDAYSRLDSGPMINLSNPGSLGPQADNEFYLSSQPYMRQRVIPVVYAAPTGFEALDNQRAYIEALNSIMTTRTRTIEGLVKTVEVEYAQSQFGAAGENMNSWARTSRAPSDIVHTLPEFYGKPVNRFFQMWIDYFLGQADSQRPLVTTLDGGPGINDLLDDVVGLTMLYIEPEPLYRYALEAWLVTGMKPRTAGEVVGNYDKLTPLEETVYSIGFAGTTLHSQHAKTLADQWLQDHLLVGTSPTLQPTGFTDVDAAVRAAGGGYGAVLDRAATNTIERP